MTAQRNPFAYPNPITIDTLPDLFAHHASRSGGWRMEDAGGDGGDDGKGSGDAGNGGDKGAGNGDAYTPPASQADLDRIVGERLARDRAKFGGLTPEDLQSLREKAERQDALEEELASDKDKAVKETRTTVEQEQAAKYQPLLAETAFRVAIGDRKPDNEVDDFIADLNLSRFLTDDGKVDTAKVLARVEQFAPAPAQQQQRGPHLSKHQANGKPAASVDAGRELFQERHGKKQAS